MTCKEFGEITSLPLEAVQPALRGEVARHYRECRSCRMALAALATNAPLPSQEKQDQITETARKDAQDSNWKKGFEK